VGKMPNFSGKTHGHRSKEPPPTRDQFAEKNLPAQPQRGRQHKQNKGIEIKPKRVNHTKKPLLLVVGGEGRFFSSTSRQNWGKDARDTSGGDKGKIIQRAAPAPKRMDKIRESRLSPRKERDAAGEGELLSDRTPQEKMKKKRNVNGGKRSSVRNKRARGGC